MCLRLTRVLHGATLAIMRFRASYIPVLALTLLAGSAVYAQEAEPTGDAGVPLADQAKFAEVEGISRGDMQTRGQKALQEMLGWQQNLAQRLGQAREQQNMVLTNCINPILTSVKALLAVANQALPMIASEGLSNAAHEYGKVVMARDRAQKQYQKSESCVGDVEVLEGDEGTSLEVSIESDDEEIVGEDFNTDAADQQATETGAGAGTDEWMNEINTEVQRPPPASNFM